MQAATEAHDAEEAAHDGGTSPTRRGRPRTRRADEASRGTRRRGTSSPTPAASRRRPLRTRDHGDKLKITQTRSRIGQKPRHRATLDTLGLRKINDTTIRERTDVLEGQLRLVNHLVRVEEAKEA